MGNNESVLDDCMVEFDDPSIPNSDFTFLGKKVYRIDTISAAKEVCDRLLYKDNLYVDCEGKIFGHPDSEIGTVQIAVDKNCCYIFDVVQCRECFFELRKVFESERVHKVFHDCSGDVAALQNVKFSDKRRITVNNIGDAQVAQDFVDNPSPFANRKHAKKFSLPDLYRHIFHEECPRINVKPSYPNKWLNERPMTEKMIKYAAMHVLLLCQIHFCQTMCIPEYLMDDYKSAVMKVASSKLSKSAKPHISFSEPCYETSSVRAYCRPSSSGTSENCQSSSLSPWVTGAVMGIGALIAAAAVIGSANEDSERRRRRRN